MTRLKTCVSLRSVGVRFRDHQVLHEISLDIEANAITVLIGRSGSGKTTFLRILNRLNELFENCHTTGQTILEIGGRSLDIYDPLLPVELLRRKVGMVFQNPNLLPLSIYRNIAMPLRIVTGAKKNDIEDMVESALRKVQLWDEVKDRLKSPALSLSGGQQQRLCLARTLSLEPEILLLDEPTASLDFKAAEKIEELLSSLRESYTIIAVSHSMNQTFRIADEIVVLKEGGLSSVIDPSQTADQQCRNDIFLEIF